MAKDKTRFRSTQTRQNIPLRKELEHPDLSPERRKVLLSALRKADRLAGFCMTNQIGGFEGNIAYFGALGGGKVRYVRLRE
jgi:hypothetical protein